MENTFQFIFEQTAVVSNSEISILEEGKTRDGYPKTAFRSRLQESDVVNSNKRIYSTSVCEAIVRGLAPKAKSRSMLMEIDHPMFFPGSTDPQKLKQRAGMIEVKNSAAVCRNIDYNGKEIIGEIETLSSFMGPELAKLILDDHVDIGFSLRALGKFTPVGNGTFEVQQPIMPITYDIVNDPSHKTSRVMEFLPEADLNILKCSNGVCSNDTVLLESDHVRFEDRFLNVDRFVDEIIKESYNNIIKKNIVIRL